MEQQDSPSLLRYLLGFLAVGIAWGFTTPFMRLAALKEASAPAKVDPNASWIKGVVLSASHAVLDLVRRPAYTVPLVINLSGSAAFFLIVGQAELSLTVPITNSFAFLFTVVGEWCAEGKAIDRDTWVGMALVLTGIAVCVYSKTAA